MMIFFYSSKNKRKVFFEFFFLKFAQMCSKVLKFLLIKSALLSHRKETMKKTREREAHNNIIKIHLFAAVVCGDPLFNFFIF